MRTLIFKTVAISLVLIALSPTTFTPDLRDVPLPFCPPPHLSGEPCPRG